MKALKKLITAVLLVAVIVTMTEIPIINNPVIAQAATIKINKKSLSLEVGQSKQLTVTTKKTVKWSSSKKSVATVTSKGKVTAVAVGKATITASVAGKKYTCAITVTASANPYLQDAPFKAVEQQIGNIDFVMPADWTLTNNGITPQGVSADLNPNDSTLSNSSIQIGVNIIATQIPTYDELKATVVSSYTEDYFKSALKTALGDISFELKDFKQSDVNVAYGKVVKTEYTIDLGAAQLKQYGYDFIVGKYIIEIISTDANNLDLDTVTEYIINSVIVK